MVSHRAAQAMALGARRLARMRSGGFDHRRRRPRSTGRAAGRLRLHRQWCFVMNRSPRLAMMFAGEPDVIRHLATMAAARVALDRLSAQGLRRPRSCDGSPTAGVVNRHKKRLFI